MIAVLALTSDHALGPYLRGRLWMAGIRRNTPLSVALDVLDVVMMDTPVEALTKRRQSLEIEMAVARARAGRVDRDSWGVPPD